jgi:hypothetical protein
VKLGMLAVQLERDVLGYVEATEIVVIGPLSKEAPNGAKTKIRLANKEELYIHDDPGVLASAYDKLVERRYGDL